MPIYNCACEFLYTGDAESIFGFGNVRTKLAEFVRHDCDTVSFFDAQFLSITHDGFTFSTQRCDHEYREFIDHPHDNFTTNFDTLKGTVLNPQFADRFTAFETRFSDRDLRPHC